MWNSFVWITFVLFDFENLVSAQCGCCNDYQGCYGDSFADVSTDIECNGYFSCYHGNTNSGVLRTTSNANIFCGGYFGCGTRNIIEADGYLFCRGHWGCQNANFIRGDSGVWCTGL